MRRLGAVALLLGAATGVAATVIACSDMTDELAYGDPTGRNPGADAGFPGANENLGQASGVAIVHAAAFPSFRLCFSNLPELRPQPDATLMPQANVVGVEVGSIVRINPLAAPGTVYVIDEFTIRSSPGKDQRTCGQLICSTPGCLRPNADYHEAGALTEPLGNDRVHLLAITGCGGGSFLGELGIDKNDCGAGYNATTGSLVARPIPLTPKSAATDNVLPVQLVHLSTPLEARRGNGTLEVSFGAIEDAGANSVATQKVITGPIFAPSEPTELTVNQKVESFYGQHGFQIGIRAQSDGGSPVTDAGDAGDGGKPSTSPTTTTILHTQSLADVQALSTPGAIPTSYFKAASNYALLILGDPRITRVLADGGPNDNYDPRRGLHILAIPVKEATDAGPGSVDSPPITEDGGGQ